MCMGHCQCGNTIFKCCRNSRIIIHTSNFDSDWYVRVNVGGYGSYQFGGTGPGTVNGGWSLSSDQGSDACLFDGSDILQS